MLGITIPKMFLAYFFIKTKLGMDYFWEKTFFHKSYLLMTPYYDVTISDKECFIKIEWVVQLRYILSG